jgi:hypothetical protein
MLFSLTSFLVLSITYVNAQAQAPEQFNRETFVANTTVVDQTTFCDLTGNLIANGTQVKDSATCSNTIMGEVPTFDKMVSTIILSPTDGEDIVAKTPVEFRVKVSNMQLGTFLDPQTLYYSKLLNSYLHIY